MPATGHDELDLLVEGLLDAAIRSRGDDPARAENRDQLRLLLDLKIAASALAEMREAYLTFAPYRHRRKVTIFGSARTERDDPLYQQTQRLARTMAGRDWMVVTGAGPGIMQAGLEGAGRANALGASIKLPFESEANAFVDPERLVEMKYFFTRKLALIRESSAFVVMPGGFGTLDESFELLTLLQTGKATPVPVVMLGLGQGFWHAWERFVDVVVEQGYAGASDRSLYRITNDVDEAAEEIIGFYRNYDSARWVGDRLVLRLQRAPDAARLAHLNDQFAGYLETGTIEVTGPTAAEVRDGDRTDLARIVCHFSRRQPGRLRALIDACNEF
jgi:uncharacterized protein (TIGR00730 family)